MTLFLIAFHNSVIISSLTDTKVKRLRQKIDTFALLYTGACLKTFHPLLLDISIISQKVNPSGSKKHVALNNFRNWRNYITLWWKLASLFVLLLNFTEFFSQVSEKENKQNLFESEFQCVESLKKMFESFMSKFQKLHWENNLIHLCKVGIITFFFWIKLSVLEISLKLLRNSCWKFIKSFTEKHFQNLNWKLYVELHFGALKKATKKVF